MVSTAERYVTVSLKTIGLAAMQCRRDVYSKFQSEQIGDTQYVCSVSMIRFRKAEDASESELHF